MIHLRAVDNNPIDFIDEVINAKNYKNDDKEILRERDEYTKNGCPIPEQFLFKERCQKIRIQNEKEINEYVTLLYSDKLEKVSKGIPHVVVSETNDKDDFVSLYSREAKEIRNLRNKILNNMDGFCPICGINKANTMDHYLPKSKYPLFSVHPQNLIPCCSECNSHKLDNVFLDDGSRKYWNAYLDTLPVVKFLFCDISVENELPIVQFRIDQGTIPDNLWAIISTTYEDMKLIESYNESARNVINEMIHAACNTYKKFQGEKSLDNCLNLLNITIAYSDNLNEWKYVLKKTLVINDIFKNCVRNSLTSKYKLNS